MDDSRRAALCGVAVVLLLGGGAMWRYPDRAEGGIAADLPALDGCVRTAPEPAEWSPVFVAANEVRSERFQCDKGTLDVRLAVWLRQSPGREAVSSENEVVPKDWRFVSLDSSAELSGNVNVNEYAVRRDDRNMVVWSWYAIGQTPVASPFAVKLEEAVNAALLRPAPTAIFTLVARSSDLNSARELLRSSGDTLWRWYVANLESV